MRHTGDVTGGKPIAVLLQSISGVSAINPLVAFYDIQGGKREVLFFYFVPDTTQGTKPHYNNICIFSIFQNLTEFNTAHNRRISMLGISTDDGTDVMKVRYHIYHSRFIPEGVAEESHIFLRDTHVLPKLVSYEDTTVKTGGKPIAI
jgi:hypothetical protein